MHWLKKVLRRLFETHMPLSLTFLRHGESEGNVAMDLIKQDRYDEIPVKMHGVPGWQWRLTERGVRQAHSAGNWLRREVPAIGAAFVSPYIRALETAIHLNMEGRIWRIRMESREREYGTMDHIPFPGELEAFNQLRAGRKSNPIFWSPLGGESIAETMFRVDRFYQTLHREHEDDHVLVVCHGETILANILQLCRTVPEDYYRMREDGHGLLEIGNCQIVQFSRIDPWSGRVSDHLDWVRSVCPTGEGGDCDWMHIERMPIGDSQLRTMVGRYPKYL